MAVEILDTGTVPESLRVRLARWYRELADDNRRLGQHDLALDADTKASALEYGGEITFSERAS